MFLGRLRQLLAVLLVILAGLAGMVVGASQSANAAVPSQLIVVNSARATDTTAKLTAYQRGRDGKWKAVLGPIRAFVGAKGIGQPQDDVHRTPAGTFGFDVAFGRLPNPGAKFPYTQVTTQDWWDANSKSLNYNRLVHQAKDPGEGSENLYNSGPVYDYAINIAHNPMRIPGRAAGIFLHVTDNQPTWGCVAVDKNSMKQILQWLDPAQAPRITIGVNVAAPRG